MAQGACRPCPLALPGGPSQAAYPSGTQVLRLGGQVLRHLPAARGQVQDGSGGHVGSLHVVRIVKAALAAGAAGTAAAAATAQVAAAAGRVAAGSTAAGAGVLAVPLRWGDTGRVTRVPAEPRRPAPRPAPGAARRHTSYEGTRPTAGSQGDSTGPASWGLRVWPTEQSWDSGDTVPCPSHSGTGMVRCGLTPAWDSATRELAVTGQPSLAEAQKAASLAGLLISSLATGTHGLLSLPEAGRSHQEGLRQPMGFTVLCLGHL